MCIYIYIYMYVLYCTGIILFLYISTCTPTFISIFICLRIFFTILHDYEGFHAHTHVHSTVHKLHVHIVAPLSFGVTPQADSLLC